MKSLTLSSERTVSPSDRQKKEKLRGLRLERGGRYAQRPSYLFTTGEIRLTADMIELFGEVTASRGRRPPRRFQRVAYGEARPWSKLARDFVTAKRAGAPIHQLLAIVGRLDRFVCELYRPRSDKSAA